MSTRAELRQLLVLGRGIEDESTDYPGQVIYDSPRSGDSYDRAAAAASYMIDHPEIKRVVISGGITFVTPESLRPVNSEADAMRQVAIHLGAEATKIVTDGDSLSTFGNFVNVATRRLLVPDQRVGLVVHSDHAERALHIGSIVMPHTEFEVILADNEKRQNRNATAGYSDKIAKALYGVAMVGVRKGDLRDIDRRDRAVQTVVVSSLDTARALKNLAHGNTGTQNRRAA